MRSRKGKKRERVEVTDEQAGRRVVWVSTGGRGNCSALYLVGGLPPPSERAGKGQSK